MTLGKHGRWPPTYKVTVMKTLIENPQINEDDHCNSTNLSTKIHLENTTDLTITVTDEKNQTFTLDAGDAVKIPSNRTKPHFKRLNYSRVYNELVDAVFVFRTRPTPGRGSRQPYPALS